MTSLPNQSFVSLMYHNVCESPAVDGKWDGFKDLSPSVTGYFIDQQDFNDHCRVVANSQLALGVDEFREVWDGSATQTMADVDSSNRPRVLITFDDGWRGTVEWGGPILEAHGLQAILFVTTDLIGHPHFVDRQQLQKLPETFVIGSHAKSHRLLAELSDNDVRRELRDSKAVLEDILGVEVDTIAYPGGSFDRRVLELTREAGYRLVFTSRPSVNRLSRCATQYGRLAVKSGTSVETLERWLRGDVLRERLRVFGLDGTKRLLGRDMYRRLRSRLISEDVAQLEMTDLAATIHPDVECSVAVPWC